MTSGYPRFAEVEPVELLAGAEADKLRQPIVIHLRDLDFKHIPEPHLASASGPIADTYLAGINGTVVAEAEQNLPSGMSVGGDHFCPRVRGGKK